MFFEVKRHLHGNENEFRNEFYIKNETKRKFGGINIDLHVKYPEQFLSKIQIVRVYKENLAKEAGFFQKFRKEFIFNRGEKNYFIFLGDFDITKNINELAGSINALKARGLDGNNTNHYIDLTKFSNNKDKETLKDKIRKCITFFYLLDNYNYSELFIAQEYHDFHFLKLQDSSITIPGGHSESVLSFSFHTETKALSNSNESLNDISKFLNMSNKNWTLYYKVLLIDDYAEKSLRSSGNEELGFSKLQYIILFLSASILRLNENVKSQENYQISLNGNKPIDKFTDLTDEPFKSNLKEEKSEEDFVLSVYRSEFKIFKFDFHTKTNVADALNSNNAYDLILLDYLFSDYEDKSKTAKNIDKNNFTDLTRGKLHYGISLLEMIKNNVGTDREQVKLKQSPLNKYWILPISTFSHAMIDEMQNMGISFVNKGYHLSRGADPINTPYLFLSKFLQIIEKQIEFSLNGIRDFDSKWKFRINKRLNQLTSQEIDIDSKRGVWLKEMDEVAEVFSNIQKLRDDESNGSLFAKSINVILKEESVKQKLRILSHYRELMYQLSFHPMQNNENVIIETQKLHYLMTRYQN